jgi:CheY-like chemotaxis protein
VLSPFLNFVVLLLAAILAWFNRERISTFFETLNVRSVEVSKDHVKVELFERQISEAYTNKGLDPPSEDDRREIRRIGEYLAPFVKGRRILWVDDIPKNNRLERSAFVGLQIDVQACRSTEEAMVELEDDPEGYDLVISDWTRSPQKEKDLSEGLRLLRKIRSSGAPIKGIPVIFYHGEWVESKRTQRRELMYAQGATGETVSPGELLRTTMAELVRKALLDVG